MIACPRRPSIVRTIRPALTTGRGPAGAGVALLLAIALAGCWPSASAVTPAQPPAKDPDIVRVSQDQLHQLDIIAVKPHKFRVYKVAVGQIAFNEDASTVVQTPFTGRVIRVIAKIGDIVKPGDPLFEVDSPEVVQVQTDLISALQAVEKTRTSLMVAQRQAERTTRLLADKAISMREAEQARNDQAIAESDLKTAEGTLHSARNRLRVFIGRDQAEVDRLERERIINPLVTVNSPIEGTVIARKIGPGQYVRADAGDSLYGIANLSTMWLKANVPEVDIPHVSVGQDLEVKVTALPDRVFHAQVIAIGAASDASTRRVVVRSEIPNPGHVLKSEMFASFKIATNAGEDAPAIPSEAVIWEGEQAVVWIEREPMVLQRRRVKVGMEQDGRMQVRDGLKSGDLVVSRGAIFVQNELDQ
jgi:cobalt-zinc-cadmium efflux system membrane fusion protein